MPVLTPIPGGFLHGRIIRIQGALSPSAQRYARYLDQVTFDIAMNIFYPFLRHSSVSIAG